VKIRLVETIQELQRHFGLPCDGELLEPDLDGVANETEANGRRRRDAEVLCTLAANAVGDVLELGTSHGRGAYKLATNLSHGLRCHTVNILPEQHDASAGKMITHRISKEDIGSYYRERKVTNVTQHFANTARWEVPAEIRNLALIFVDAARDEENVYLDSKRVWDRIAPGGFMVWHDFSPLCRRVEEVDASMRGVERFLEEQGLADLEVVNLRHSWCGVLRKPAARPAPKAPVPTPAASWATPAMVVPETRSPRPSSSAPVARPDGAKPRVLMLVDKRGWAYDTAAQAISKRLADEFEFRIEYVRENPDLNAWKWDLLYVFFWGETYHQKFVSDPRRVIKEISSHRWANEDAYGRLNPEQAARKYLADAGTLTATSRRLQSLFAPHREVHWCPNGFEPAVFRPADPRSGPLRIGWAGNQNDPCKGLHDVLKPAAGSDFELVLAGGDLDSAAMGRFYSSIDVLCVASTAEGEPLTLVEGMAAGVFPVAVDVGIVPELVRHGEDGFIVGREPAAFRAAFQWCRQNVARVRDAGARNARRLAEERRWDDVSPHWRQALRAAWAGLQATDSSPMKPATPAPAASGSYVSTAAASMTALKDSYFDHLKAMNPAGVQEATYQASLFYYRGELEPLLPSARDARCLDIGCGFGHLPRFLLERGFTRIGAVELDERLHAEASAYLGRRLEFLERADAVEFLAGRPEAFDFITLFDVIEHFTLDDGLLLARRIHSALRPGGRVVMRTPNMANLFGVYSRHMDLTHQIGFTEQSLSQMLRLAGYSEVGVHVPDWDPTHPLTPKLRESADFHRKLFHLQDRSTPKSFEKNIVVWARR
jgi:glycosyltransferase involved in cell wall biosynthesis/2-polyprenyl-3-methyl-5-hydroxy-6-metoxy-1,4-benzoquinol methylase